MGETKLISRTGQTPSGWVKPNLLVGQDKLPRLAESLREVAQHWRV